MTQGKKKSPKRDVEKVCTRKQFIEKLRRLADCMGKGEAFRIRIGRERLTVPATAVLTIEPERENGQQELEFQMKWKA
ncbi:MAG: amphi-Trp domain-containing protein [Syntrophaceae bacterium]|nr:amphi-Trp domain-containing protein [Syntrophaceae bacterium]